MRRRSTVSAWMKSTARMPRACAVRNCFQAGPVRRGAGPIPAACRICHSGGRDGMTEPDEFASHAPVPPRGVLRRHADHQLADRGCRGRSPGTPPAGVIPLDRAPQGAARATGAVRPDRGAGHPQRNFPHLVGRAQRPAPPHRRQALGSGAATAQLPCQRLAGVVTVGQRGLKEPDGNIAARQVWTELA